MSETGEVHPVSSRAWMEVLHAEVGTRLAAAGVPCLHIKGPTVATWLYEPGERSWGDVDILVPPHRMDDALEVLLASGFSYRHPGVHWRTSEDHALTLWHDPRGDARHKVTAEVDVHHRFLGIDADPERAFAELWRRREPARLAELDVWFPDLTSRALIVVLNVARDPHGVKAPTDLRRLLAATPDDEWKRTIALARRIGALEALRAGLETADTGRELVSRTSLADVSVSAAVRLRAEGSSRTAVRLEELRTFGTLKKIRMVVGWVVPSPAVIRMREPTAAGSPWRMARAYLERYRQGARELAAAVRAKRGQLRGPAAGARVTSGDTTPPEALAAQGAGLRETTGTLEGGAPTDEVVETVRGITAADVAEPGETVGGYRRPAHVGVAHDGDQIVLLDLRDGERRVLSPTAAAIWDTLMAAGSLEATVAWLEDEFPDASGLLEDTERFVAGLEAQGLLERG